jgi:glycine betaine/proline transport system substrate-binding protein
MKRGTEVKLLALGLMSAIGLSGAAALAADGSACAKVRMAEPGWTDLAFTTGVASVLLQGLGYETDSQVLGLPIIYQSLENGQLDLFLGYWDPAMVTYSEPFTSRGTVETVKQNLDGAKFTFVVPRAVYDAGVHDFADLAAHKAEFDGKLYGIEPGSNEIMLKIVADDAFGLGDWEVVESSEQGMLAQVARAVGRQEWIVFLGWAPHPMNTQFDLAYLSGGDDYYGPDFGGATVHTQVRKGYVQACPNIGRLLDNLVFDVALESAGMGSILNDGMTPEEAARTAIKADPALLDRWLAGVETIDGGDGTAAVKQALGL